MLAVLLLRRRPILLLWIGIAVGIRCIRVGVGIITAAVVWISVCVRIAVIAAIPGVAVPKSESNAAPVPASITVAAAISVASPISTSVAATVTAYRAAAISTADGATAGSTSTHRAGSTATTAVGAAATASMTAATPLRETSSAGKHQRDKCDLQRTHRKLLS